MLQNVIVTKVAASIAGFLFFLERVSSGDNVLVAVSIFIQASFNKIDVFKQFIINGLSRFDSLQFIKNSGKLIFESFIHFGVALYNNISAETTTVAVFLFGKTGERNSNIYMLMFFG